MSTSAIAISNAALANSVVALTIAERARIDACKGLIKEYNGRTLQPQEMQEYASCIEMVYPRPATEADILAVKILIIAALVGAIFGFVWGVKEDGPGLGILIAIIGLVATPLVLVLLYGVFMAARFLIG